MTDRSPVDVLAEFDGSVCPACHHHAHDPGSCPACPRCELHTDEALAFVLRIEPDLITASGYELIETAEVERLRAGHVDEETLADILAGHRLANGFIAPPLTGPPGSMRLMDPYDFAREILREATLATGPSAETCGDDSWDARYACIKPKGHPTPGPGLTDHDYQSKRFRALATHPAEGGRE